MKKFRKYFEPTYGEPSPEIFIGPPQVMDMENPAVSRNIIHTEEIADYTNCMKRSYCYESIMEIGIKNIFVKNKEYLVPVRIYEPIAQTSKSAMIFYHGGGWVMNNLDVYDYVCRYFAKYGGFVVISVDYRLAPEHPFPAAIEDCYAAVQWAYDHADELGIDKNKICLCGDSAGGNFAAVVAQMARDRKGPHVDGQILFYPATILETSYRFDSEERYGDGGYFLEINSVTGNSPSTVYLPNKEDVLNPYASPLLAEDLSALPRSCFISAECDPLLDQALMYAAALEDANVPVEYHFYEGMIHAFILYPYQKTFESFNAVIQFVNQ